MNRRGLLLASSGVLAAPALASAQGLSSGGLQAQQGTSVAGGWRLDVLARWGDPVLSDAPAWAPNAPDADAVSAQFGWDAELLAVFTPPRATDGVPRAVVAVAHPGVDPAMAYPDGRDRPDVSAAMQGVSIINLEKRGRAWVLSSGGYQSRHLGARTLCRADGPAAEQLGGAINGIYGAGAGCGTADRLLLAESEASDWTNRLPGRITAAQGWVVEVNPFEPSDIPVKRTALGRAPQAIAAQVSPEGKLVVYLAHQTGLARFVSAEAATSPDALAAGTLSAARFNGADVTWAPLGADAWQDLPAALAQAGARPLPAGASLAIVADALVVGAPGQGATGLRGVVDTSRVTSLLPAGMAPGLSALTGDQRGQLWIGNDAGYGYSSTVMTPDGRPALVMPRGARVGGLGLSPDGAALFTCIRTPGAEPGRSYSRPATRWPDFTPGTPPRSALVAIERG
ncbi:alkaline phosphatase PhoX [Rhodovarius crocodyli]|nr:alkaline phosphatase PhoX [Rhodovarius crocodyli]